MWAWRRKNTAVHSKQTRHGGVESNVYVLALAQISEITRISALICALFATVNELQSNRSSALRRHRIHELRSCGVGVCLVVSLSACHVALLCKHGWCDQGLDVLFGVKTFGEGEPRVWGPDCLYGFDAAFAKLVWLATCSTSLTTVWYV